MYLLRMALRNLSLHRGRTLLIAGILTLAVVFFLFMESLMMGLMEITFDNVIDFETPHIEIGRERFFTEADAGKILPLEETFLPGTEMLNAAEAAEGFSALTPVLDFSADFIAGRHEFPVRVRAIDPHSFGLVFKNQEYLVQGSFVEPHDSGVVIGDQLARFFNLEVGDFYTLRFKDKRGSFNTIEGKVKGITSTPHPQINLGTVLVAQDRAASALRLEEGAISRLMIRLDNRKQALSQAGLLREVLGDPAFAVRSYRDAAELLVALEAWGFLETYFILGLFLLVGVVGIISAVVLAAIERIKEIGMMKALGLKTSEIVRVFLLEAAGIGAIGGLIGCALGAVVVIMFKVYGINMETFADLGAMGVPLGSKIYGAWNTSSFVLILLFVIVVAVAACLVPAYWAARKNPVEAIQHK